MLLWILVVTLYSTYMHVHHWANEHANDLQFISCLIYCLKEFICNCSPFPGLSVCDSIFHFDIPLSASYPSQRLSLSPFPLQAVTALHRCFSSSCYRFSTRLARINKSAIGAKQVRGKRGQLEGGWNGVTLCYREENAHRNCLIKNTVGFRVV